MWLSSWNSVSWNYVTTYVDNLALVIKYPTIEYYIIIIFLYQWSLMRISFTLVYIYVGLVGVCTQHYILWAQMRNLTLVYIYIYIYEIKRNVYTILFSSLPYTLVHTIKYGIA